MIDADNGMLTAKNLNDQFADYRRNIEFDTFVDADLRTPRAWIKLKEKLFGISRLCREGKWQYDALCIDSLTRMGILCANQIMFQAGRPMEVPQLQHYNAIVSEMRNMLQLITSLPVMVLAVTHELPVETDESTFIKCRVVGQKLPDEVIGMFDEVWYTKVKKLPKDQGFADYLVSCLPSTSRDSRTRSGKLQEFSFKTLGLRGILKEMGYEYKHEIKKGATTGQTL